MSMDRRLLAACCIADCLAGDPEWLLHPVKLFGRTIESGERLLRKPVQSPATELLTGGALSVSLIAAAYLATEKTIAWANRRAGWLGIAVEVWLGWTCLAARNLHDEALAVVDALDRGDMALARARLARIVGRDTRHLDVAEVSRALIETLAESASDGVIAPLFYLAMGGVPLAMAYKAINTLDSMIGHADQRYFYFGKVAARLDDLANLLPARLTALAIAISAAVLPGSRFTSAMNTWFHDGMKHASPNAGQPESAMAGALQVRLGGENSYGGRSSVTPFLGTEFPTPTVAKARNAIHVVTAVSALGVIAALITADRKR